MENMSLKITDDLENMSLKITDDLFSIFPKYIIQTSL